MIVKKRMLLIFGVVLVVAVMAVARLTMAGMAVIPIDLDDVSEEDIDRQALRVGIIAELDAVNLYEQLAAKAKDERVKKIMMHTAKEEKTHVGEFQALLLMLDKEQKEELVEGAKELEETLAE